jgi:opacity protein-like surface antigen
MLKRISLVAATVAVLSLSAHAFAATAQSGAYVGVNGGWSFAKDPSVANTVSASDSHKNYVYGATLGYDYALNQNVLVGAELNYSNFGKTTFNSAGTNNINADFKTTAYQLLATSTYVMNNGWDMFGKLGAAHAKSEINGSLAGTNVDSYQDSKWLPAAAVGAGYMFNQNLNVALQWEHIFGQNWNNLSSTNTPSKPITQDAITLGVTYKFAM